MDLLYLFGEAAAGGEQAAGWQVILFYIIFFDAIILAFYFLLVKPQKKEEAKRKAVVDSVEVGDSVVTTAGFYGVVIDMVEEQNIIVVEFGNNKNCRIPMKKSAVVEVEKASK